MTEIYLTNRTKDMYLLGRWFSHTYLENCVPIEHLIHTGLNTREDLLISLTDRTPFLNVLTGLGTRLDRVKIFFGGTEFGVDNPDTMCMHFLVGCLYTEKIFSLWEHCFPV